MEQSPLLVVLKIVDSLLSPFPSPPDRLGSRDEIPCWWCCIVTVQFSQKLKKCFRCELFDCLICLRCLQPRFIDQRLFSPLLSRTGRRPTIATLTLDLCDTGFHPITVAKTARDQPQPTERKPWLIIKRVIFYSAPKIVLGTVPTRGERRQLDALIVQFEVLPESEVLRTPGGQKREHRARERKTGDVFANFQPPGLYKDHHTPTHFRVSLPTILQPTP